MTVVRKTLQQKERHKASRKTAYVLNVEVAGWQIAQVYNPPREKTNLYVLLTETMVQCQVGPRDRWLFCGDYNAPTDAMAATVVRAFGFDIVNKMADEEGPTRWEGSEETDWFATNAPGDVEAAWQLKNKISDHKGQCTRINTHKRAAGRVGKVVKGADWRKPSHLDKAQWAEHLSQVWSACQSWRTDFSIARTERATPHSIEADWLEWFALLGRFYRMAFEKEVIHIERKLCDDSKQEERRQLHRSKVHMQKQLRMKHIKGQIIQFKEMVEPRHVRVEEDKAMWKGKYRKDIGRLCSMRGLLRKYGHENLEVREDMRNLRAKLRMPVEVTSSTLSHNVYFLGWACLGSSGGALGGPWQCFGRHQTGLWKQLWGGCGKLWKVLRGSEEVWTVLGGSGRRWAVPDGLESFGWQHGACSQLVECRKSCSYNWWEAYFVTSKSMFYIAKACSFAKIIDFQ